MTYSVSDMQRLLDVMAALRHPITGCPWDVAQTSSSIAPYAIEEAYEFADACQRNDVTAMKDELGDLLLQVIFHSQIAHEAGHFSFGDVAAGLSAKLVRRHPHVFVDTTSTHGTQQWEAIKESERAKSADRSTLGGVAAALPALMRAEKLQKRAARVGFDWPDANGPRAKISEELAEINAAIDTDAREDELGDVLFAVVNYARHLNIDPEIALRRANAKFERRFRDVEVLADGSLGQLASSNLEVLWAEVKAAET